MNKLSLYQMKDFKQIRADYLSFLVFDAYKKIEAVIGHGLLRSRRTFFFCSTTIFESF